MFCCRGMLLKLMPILEFIICICRLFKEAGREIVDAIAPSYSFMRGGENKNKNQ